MTRLAIDPNFSGGFSTRVGGNGSATVTNGVLSCKGSGGDSAMKDFFFPITGGANITLMVEARSRQGEARIAIDYVNSTTGVQSNLGYDYTTSTEWNLLKIDIVIPFGVDTHTGCLVFGKFGSQNQTVDVEFRNPECYIENAFGSPLTIAQGLISIINGSITVNPNFKSYGIKSLELNADNVKLLLDHRYINRTSHRPLIQVTGTSDQPYVPVAGQFSTTDSSFIIKFTNGSGFQTINNLPFLYFSVLVHL